MNVLGFDINRRKAPKKDLPSSTQIRPNAPQGPMTNYFNDYVMRKVSGDFYEVLREGIPIIDSAIRRLISLNGTIRIIGDDPALVKELEDFCMSIPVNDTQKGIHAFLENASNETFEQGFSISEFTATPDLKDIAGLRVSDSKNVIYRRNTAGIAEPWYRYPGSVPNRILSNPQSIVQQILTANYGQTASIGGMYETKLNPANLIYLSINNENSDPYGVSVMRSMEFVSKILMTMQNSMLNVWERYGDPPFKVIYKAGKKSDDLTARQTQIKTDFAAAMTAKRAGKSADFVYALDKDSDITVEIIGDGKTVLQLDIPSRHVLEQIVSKTNLPAWMLGLYWSTTERMATLEVESALQDAKIRQLAMFPEFIRLFSTFLAIRGRKWKTITTDPEKPGDWGFYFETPNLRDVMSLANARFLNAQADLMERGGTSTTATSVQVGQASFSVQSTKTPAVASPPVGEVGEGASSKDAHKSSCSCGQKVHHDGKEINRPKPWPELDKVENEFETELKYDWADLKSKVFTIAGLTIPEQSAESKKGQSVKPHAPSPMPHAKAFSCTDDQRAQIMKALKDYLGWYEPGADDSTIAWYYGQSYSLGLIQAANMMGKERPILDILKNNEIYTELITDGFSLVKDNATKAIRNDIIMAMDQGMQDGVNPRDVAATLDQLFDDKNSDWERLARTEMSTAAEKAKVDEWDARGVDTEGAVIAGQDTHPRCRCANTIQDDGNGNLRMVFSPAPDACALCFSMQEGSKRFRRQGSGSRVQPKHPLPSVGEDRGEGASSQLVKALERIADRPINIKIEQSPMQLALTLDKTPMNYEMEKDPTTGKVKMKQVPNVT